MGSLVSKPCIVYTG